MKKEEALSSVLFDAYYLMRYENDQLIDEHAYLRLDCKILEEKLVSHDNSISGLK